LSLVILELFTDLGHWFRPYQYQSALAIIATVLVIFGNDINSVIKRLVAKQHFKYPSHMKMQDSAGIKNVFRQGFD